MLEQSPTYIEVEVEVEEELRGAVVTPFHYVTTERGALGVFHNGAVG